MITLLPSVLSADFANLGNELDTLKKSGVTEVHVDVMDGMFVPSISFGMPVIASMRKVSDLTFDVHMMVEEPGRYIDDMVKVGADAIGVHAEACKHLDRTIMQIRDAGKKAYVVLNPATPLSVLDYVLDKIDYVLLMTVNPGFGGQSYIPQMTEKIRDLRRKIDARGLDVEIQVDGGIKLNNVETVIDAGASRIVAGSSVFGDHTEEQIAAFLKIFAEKN